MKKYIDIDLVKNFLNLKLDQKYYLEYKNYLDAGLTLNKNFNFNSNRPIFRQAAILDSNNSIVKTGLDPRHIDQEVEYNPRRGLQHYHRSENFINESNAEKIKSLNKLHDVMEEIKEQYGKEDGWQDSYARVLFGIIEKTFNKIKSKKDFTDAQPTIGSLDYIEELLYVRYRLSFDNLRDLDNFEIKKIILSKDENLIHNPILHEKKEETRAKTLKSENLDSDSPMYKLFESLKMMEDQNKEFEVTIKFNKK